ncbi:MAG: tRNA (guanosine(37)-N1)-methyltransferase TrmD, partial [Erysipelotrichaceae bacterium]|nr:tRNA (guanosine(37)-N1)-methyltransferase TrmD [Erysipelotrichaceae bacterium]
FLNSSIVSRTIGKGLLEVELVNIRDYSTDKHLHVDDTPYGGGAGMLMKVDVLHRALNAVKDDGSYVLLTSPKSKPLVQEDLKRYSKIGHLIIVCGHYEGIDYRFEKYADEKVSIGDYILTGGEPASLVLIDGISRLLDDAIASESLMEESYDNGLLEYPQYTRPVEYDGCSVPEVLQNGNHKEIRRYNLRMALRETMIYRPDLLEGRQFTEEETEIMRELQDEMHDH